MKGESWELYNLDCRLEFLGYNPLKACQLKLYSLVMRSGYSVVRLRLRVLHAMISTGFKMFKLHF